MHLLRVPHDPIQRLRTANKIKTHGQSPMRKVEITKEPVELYKILKFEGLATTGGEAKLLVDDRQVTVNGKVEIRRRKKIVDSDVIEVRGETLKIQLVPTNERPL